MTKRAIRWSLAAAGTILLSSFLPSPPARAQGSIDPQAREIATRAVAAMGGQAAWENLRWVRFRFAGNRTHWWDKHTGRHRVELTRRDGDHYIVLQNLNTREGQAFKNGQELSGEEARQALDNAYGAWINDTYWLLMPFKMTDPGVILAPAGEETIDGNVYDKLHLRFEKVGLTPGDQYWVFVNRSTGLIDRWSYILESFEPGRAATVWQWRDWQSYGPLKLSGTRFNLTANQTLGLDRIEVGVEMPDSVFTVSEPMPEPK
ncbi:MAG TPA: hypothetical protein VF017_01700 [Thermoanaerobaculia bacterium]|nr:hypothetical protein [Thermoanaerobaculia bacterium]